MQDHPELDTKGLNLNDIYERTQLSAGHRRQIAQSKLGSTKKSQAIKIKTEQQNSTAASPINNSDHHISGFQQQLNKSQSLLMIGRTVNSDSDDEVDVKQERLSPTESKFASTVRNNHGTKTKRKMNSTAMKKVAKKMKMSGNVSQSNANSSTVRVKEENITIHHEQPIVTIKSEPTTPMPSITTMSKYVSTVKPVTLSDLDGIDMMPIDLEDCSNIDIVNDVDDNQIVYKTPELMQETHVCYFSLIRDIFCSTQYHRTTMDTLQDKVSAWLANPITALNDWYSQADDWFSLLTSAINFLAGEFADQPEDFVPYLEYKKSMHIYQWIGAGRDSDQHLSPLCDYWLNRRNEMGATQSGLSDDDDIQLNDSSRVKYNSSGELNDSGTIADRSLSPLPPRCPTTWTVGKATNAEIEEFRQQERRRFENPHLSFTYRMHGYESVVGPVKGIYTQSPAFTKARGHNMLTIDRPNFVTILTLVRDATARLPNGEGTRADICELLRSSQYINPDAADNVLQTIVSGALDRMHTENDPCVKYDPKRKIWIYLHRSRTEEEFERMHQQFQGKSKHKKQSTRKLKTKSGKSCVVAKPTTDGVSNVQQKSVLVPISRTVTVTPQTKPNLLFTSTPIQATARLLPSSQVIVTNESKLKADTQLVSSQSPSFQLPALSSIQSPSLVQISNQPPLLNKITTKSPAIKAELVPIKQPNLQKIDKMEHIDVEASLEAHTTPILLNKNSPQMPGLIVDNKFSKIVNQKTKKQVPALVTPSSNLPNSLSPLTTTPVLSSTTPIKVSTSSGIQTVHVSSAFTVSGKSAATITSGQSILINQSQTQPPLYVTNKKIIKPPPLVPQSSPSNQNFIIPINISLNQPINKATVNQQGGAKLIKTTMPALTSTSAPKSLLQQQQVLKPIQRGVQAGKSLISPSVAAANITLQQQQKLLSTNAPNAQVQIRAHQQPKLTATAVKAQGTTLSPVQQRQILQNIISQQQKQNQQRPNMISLVSSNSVIVNTTQSNQLQTSQFQAAVQTQQTLQPSKTVIVSQPNLVQKIVTTPPTMAVSVNSTTSSQSDSSPLNSQIIQIHQVNQQPGKVQRVSAANLTPQQQQNILQSIKQQQLRVQQTGSPQQQSLIIKQQQVLQQIQKQQPTLIQQPVGSPKPGKIGESFSLTIKFSKCSRFQEHRC